MSVSYSKKPEKIASALYLITSFFSDQEPMKWKIRTLASDLVSESVLLNDEFGADIKQAESKVEKAAAELSGLLSVARAAGLVSEENFSIISKEVFNYRDTLALPAGNPDGKRAASILEGFFGHEEVGADDRGLKEEISIKDKIYKPQPESAKIGVSEQSLARAERSGKPRKLKEFGAVSVKKSNRKNVIIGLLKRKKEIMVKDVAPLIEDCSEKTIQRELLSLVNEGVLKKEGEKRWSRYSLA